VQCVCVCVCVCVCARAFARAPADEHERSYTRWLGYIVEEEEILDYIVQTEKNENTHLY
jgi:hypothetical protein